MSEEANPQNEELKQLMEEKERLAQEGKYLEAEEIKQKIIQMKKGSNNLKKNNLHESHVKKRETLEGDYETERAELESKWDKKIQEFVDEGKKQEKELVETHNKKMEEYITKLTSEYPRIKYSTEYLNGRVQENKLAKQERYKEAAQKKILNDKMQQKENQKYEQERSENINKNAEILGIKQEQDLNVLRARLARIYDLLMSKKDKELDTLNNKYKNKKQELIGVQTREINISNNVHADRAWEGSNRLTKKALSKKSADAPVKETNVVKPAKAEEPFKEEPKVEQKPKKSKNVKAKK